MQQTETYKLNLIDPADAFSPDPLNDNARKIETELAECTHIYMFDYDGDNTNRRTFTFPFPPKLLIIWGEVNSGYGPLILFRGQAEGKRIGISSGIDYFNVQWSGNTVAVNVYEMAAAICNDSRHYYGAAFR